MIELDAKIKEVIQRTYNVKSFRLKIDGGPDFQAGQFCCVRLLTENECKRYLSISSSPTEKGYLEFTKKITQSEFSLKLDSLGVGDKLRIQYPFGKFTLEGAGPKAAFLSGGIGITPIRSMLKYATDKRLDMDLALIYANRGLKDIVFRDDLRLLEAQNPKLKVIHVLSVKEEGFDGIVGRINAEVIKNAIADFRQRKFYLCGPPAMVESMQGILLDELNLPKENIVTENFQGY